MKNKRMLGTTLIIVMIILMGLSIAMIASVSFPKGYKDYKNNYYFVTKQFIWFGFGTLSFWITSKFKYTWYKKIKLYLYVIGLVLLVTVLFFKGSKWSYEMVYIGRIQNAALGTGKVDNNNISGRNNRLLRKKKNESSKT